MMQLYNLISNPADLIIENKGDIGALWLGSVLGLDETFLQNNNINTIVSLCPHEIIIKQSRPIHHYHIKILRDHPDDQVVLDELTHTILQIIHQHRTQGHNILVHCRMGMQRAPTIVARYLKKYHHYTTEQAITMIKHRRKLAFFLRKTFVI